MNKSVRDGRLKRPSPRSYDGNTDIPTKLFLRRQATVAAMIFIPCEFFPRKYFLFRKIAVRNDPVTKQH